MKQILKKLSLVLMVLIFSVSGFSIAANAENTINYPEVQTFYMAGSKKAPADANIFISGLSNKESISKSSIKLVSGKSAIGLIDFRKIKSNSYKVPFEKNEDPYTYTSNYYSIGIKVKKAGIGKVSFKVGNKSYVSTVKILSYTNPIASLTVTGAKNGTSSNLAGKFKKNSTGGSIHINKVQKNAFITCKAARGWKVTSISFTNKKKNIMLDTTKTNGLNRSDGVSSLELHVGVLAAKQTGTIEIYLLNSSTGGRQTCTLELK